jgi:hypothetical protein
MMASGPTMFPLESFVLILNFAIYFDLSAYGIFYNGGAFTTTVESISAKLRLPHLAVSPWQ